MSRDMAYNTSQTDSTATSDINMVYTSTTSNDDWSSSSDYSSSKVDPFFDNAEPPPSHPKEDYEDEITRHVHEDMDVKSPHEIEPVEPGELDESALVNMQHHFDMPSQHKGIRVKQQLCFARFLDEENSPYYVVGHRRMKKPVPNLRVRTSNMLLGDQSHLVRQQLPGAHLSTNLGQMSMEACPMYGFEFEERYPVDHAPMLVIGLCATDIEIMLQERPVHMLKWTFWLDPNDWATEPQIAIFDTENPQEPPDMFVDVTSLPTLAELREE
jgi:hypothetical protein